MIIIIIMMWRKGKYLQFTSQIIDLAVQLRDLHVSNIFINIHLHSISLYNLLMRIYNILFIYKAKEKSLQFQICPLRNNVFICNVTIFKQM